MITISVIVLAGGRSRRLGYDKALLPWRGRTLIQYLVTYLQEVSDDVLVVTGTERRYQELLTVPIFPDEIRDIGPLGGLYTGLKHARSPYSLAVACDMPFVNKAVIDLLKDNAEGRGGFETRPWAVVPSIQNHRVPTCAIYHKDCLSVIEKLHAQGRSSLHALLDSVPLKILSEDEVRAVDPTLRSFVNINTQADWESCMPLGAVLSSESEL
ncbi:MAG: molybdenum cofactor guanylyltransferase [Candidatus Bipolaricaulia bacterium]